jgi:PAS domain S-box-containing protein
MKFAPKLTALLIIIGAIIAAVMFTIVYFQVEKILESEIRARMENRVFFTMDAMDRFLYERLSDIKLIAKDSVISSEDATAEQINERLISFRNAYKCYASLSFFNLERIRIADTAGMSIGEQNRMTPYWEDILSGKVSAASDVHIAKDLQVPVVYFASAVNNKEGRAIGVVVARIPTNRLFEMVKGSAKIQEEEEEEEEEIDIINKDGLLIYSNHNREGILKENLPEWELIKIAQREKIFGSDKHRNPGEKETALYAFCREQGHLDFKGNGWTIFFHIPTRVIFGPVNKLLKILIIMFLAMLPGLALVSYLFSKTVSLPLVRLSFAAAEIGKGKLDTVIEERSKDEFGSLANAFSQMVADLKKTTTSIDYLNKEISERKKAEEALRESEARYKVLFFSAAEGIAVADLQTKRFSYVNPTMCRMFGYTEEELTRIGVADIHPKESLDHVLAEFEAQVRGEKTLANGLPCLRKDGALFYANVNAALIVLDDRKCLVGFFTDTTENKKAEEALRESEELLSEMTTQVPGVVYQFYARPNGEMGFYYVSDRSEQVIGLKPDLEGYLERFVALVIPEHRESFIKSIEKAVKESSEWKYEGILQKPSGEKIWFSGNSTPTPCENEMVFNGIVFDISERKRSENALLAVKDYTENIIKSMLDTLIVINPDGKIKSINKAVTDLLGYKEEELVDKPFGTIVAEEEEEEEEEIPFIGTRLKKLIKEGFIKEYDTAYKTKSGEMIPVSLSGAVMRDKDDKLLGIICIGRDLRERKKAEDTLRASEIKHRTLLENLPQKIFRKDRNSVYISCNENYAHDLKIKPEEIAGRTDLEFYPKELVEKYRADDKRIIESGKTEDIEEKYIQDGEERFVHTTKTPIKDEQGNVVGILGIFWDVTERKQAEEKLNVAYQELQQTQQELIQVSKMAAMGQLAAGISHELNQPLTGIKGFTQAVLADLEKESPFRSDLNKIVEQADRIDAIIKNVRFFARKSDFNMVETDINQVILESLMLLNQQLKVHNIRVIQELGLGIPKMQGDPNQLQQAFINIINNARDAILSLNRPEGGEIRIRTALSQDKKHVEINCQDTGGGIPEENLENMFTPFFTTKSPDKGMGLGLSITYRIIENHQGKIDFKTKVGEGTTFRIALPLRGGGYNKGK